MERPTPSLKTQLGNRRSTCVHVLLEVCGAEPSGIKRRLWDRPPPRGVWGAGETTGALATSGMGGKFFYVSSVPVGKFLLWCSFRDRSRERGGYFLLGSFATCNHMIPRP